jgi:hypothetical protein
MGYTDPHLSQIFKYMFSIFFISPYVEISGQEHNNEVLLHVSILTISLLQGFDDTIGKSF